MWESPTNAQNSIILQKLQFTTYQQHDMLVNLQAISHKLATFESKQYIDMYTLYICIIDI